MNTSTAADVQQTAITLHHPELAQRYPDMVHAIWTRSQRFAGCAIEIHPSERRTDGWLEWHLIVTNACGFLLTIGAIERCPGSAIEFHS